ncbi:MULTISPECIES: RidA family protein [unclassified Beijerinckia]|uniref:RidA family protein n=1 Tax=unclassified Beijerinckia TaxID=2638183 RepID=UPI0008970843|nr:MULTISPECIES: RidA family protein [unclassified Beijerinckia]MDH7794792.1 enamine deaminase RidA (YjgF/YER057c/UK114 family) [Beijerinckia sp. GAS462]SEB75397.1 Enamine deaminase RidA, house cleaning of reactive enamine intermediates, YjgF/YER057c/UK114 family [Beijerinckia sp. 28-YEA-48]
MSAEARLIELGIVLPEVRTPLASYVQFRVCGNMLYLAGQGPHDLSGHLTLGKLGQDLSVEEGIAAARLCGLNLLAVARQALGSLDRIDQVVKMLCLVNATPDFTQHPTVANGMSDLMANVFGESGRHARSAIGVPSLPHGMAVEIEGIFSIVG